jgi:hypothetical protein
VQCSLVEENRRLKRSLLSPSSGRFIAVMMYAVSTSETSVSFYETTRCNTLKSYLHTSCRENLRNHHFHLSFTITAVNIIWTSDSGCWLQLCILMHNFEKSLVSLFKDTGIGVLFKICGVCIISESVLPHLTSVCSDYLKFMWSRIKII